MRSGQSRRRLVKDARLAFGEGGDDSAWLKYIKTLLYRRDDDFIVRVKHGTGGSAIDVVESMMKLDEFDQYAVKYVIFDGDRAEVCAAVEKAHKNGIVPIVSKRCLEEELLRIAGKKLKVSSSRGTNIDTRLIKEQFISECGKHNEYCYTKHFPLGVLEKKRSGSEWLDQIMKIFE